MAQSVLKSCEICMGGLRTHYCLQCQQYFCGICKAQHTRIKVSRNHEFQSGENVVQEVKLRCEEHKEDFVFRCDKCKVSICMQCVTGKHKGHAVSNMKEFISSLKTTFRAEMHTKLDVIQANGKQIEEGLTKFELSATSVIHALTAEGTKIKAMVDRQIEKMIATLNEKASHEKDSLTKVLSDCKQQLKNVKAIEKREEEIQSRDDSSIIEHLQKLNDEISKLAVVPLPEFPSVKYSPRPTNDSDVRQLIGTYSLSMRSVVEESSGARSGGAQLLSDMITGKGDGSDSQKSNITYSSRKISLIQNARGDMRFEGCQPDGGKVIIRNGGTKGFINLKGWTLKKIINGVEKYTYTFNDISCSKGQEITLVAKGCEDTASQGDIIVQNFTWGTMGTFYLYDDKNEEKCSLDIRIN